MRQCSECSGLFEDDVERCPVDAAPLSSPDALLGATIDDKYRVDGLIGTGGMGAVYRATQLTLARPAAIKVVHDFQFANDVVAERFRREALAVARLKHPHIVTIYDFGISPAVGAYIVMEHLEGRPLVDAIDPVCGMALEDVLRITSQVCAGMAAAHASGVIHRDLKPQNIFLERTPDGEVAKVLDFGVAKLDAGDEGNVTKTGMVIGTPLYMSPEQCEGLPLDARSDIYSLGCVVYEMLTGRQPFVGGSIHSVLIKHLSERPEPPSTHAAHAVGANVDAAVLRALAKRPEDRFASAAEFARALTAQPSSTPVATPAQRVVTPTNLAREITNYVGRARETAKVRELMESARLVMLSGPGGIGKTRLATHAAANLFDKFPDGVWFVELDVVREPARVPSAIAEVLQLREDDARPLASIIAATIGTRRILLVLDNCEHVVDACADLVQALLRTCPSLAILATSRETLRVEGEAVLRVPPLAVPTSNAGPDELMEIEAVRLLVDRIRLRAPTFEVTDENAVLVARICRRLEGIPLAIELAAARANVLSLDQIAARLDDRFRLLGGGSRTSLARQRTLLAAIDWSHDLLTEDERVLFRRLSVFGGWSLEAAEAVCVGGTVDVFDVLDGLSRLVDKSLVVVVEREDGVRYRMLETLREYGRTRLAESGEADETLARHLDWALALAERAQECINDVEQDDRLDWLERDHENLRAALAWAVDENRAPEKGLQLCTCLANFWYVRGYAREGRAWIEKALERAPHEETAERAQAYLGAGRLAFNLSDLHGMRRHCEASLEIARAIGDDELKARSLSRLGLALIFVGDFERATEYVREQLLLAGAAGDRLEIAQAWQGLGLLAFATGRYAEAIEHYAEAVAEFRALGSSRFLAPSLLNQGEAAFFLGDYDAAEANLLDSLRVARLLGFQLSTAYALYLLGNVALDRGEYARARGLITDALDIATKVGEERCVAHALEAAARASVVLGHPDRALRLAAAATTLRAAIRAPLFPPERAYLDGYWARARATLTPEHAAAAYALGEGLTMAEAVEFARSWPDDDSDVTVILARR